MGPYLLQVPLALYMTPANRPAGLEFPHCAGRYRSGAFTFSSGGCRICNVYGGMSEPGLSPYPPRVALALFTRHNQSTIGWWGWGFHTVRGDIDPAGHHIISTSELEVGPYPPRVARAPCTNPSQSAIGLWGSHTVRSGFNPSAPRFSFPDCRSCRRMEGFENQWLDSILLGWRWLDVRAPANQRSGGGVRV